jgi:5S rRNA maturation endonuclease (ribonuclease M5)
MDCCCPDFCPSYLRYGQPADSAQLFSEWALSVDREKGTWFDHENKQGGGVLDLVRRERKCDQRAAVEWLKENTGLESGPPAKAKPDKQNRGRVVARYIYTDAGGRPVHRTLRFEPRGFSQQRFEGGKWIGGKGALDGVERVLYHSRDVLAADEVVIVEGEKDADRLRSLGFTATTNPEGVGKWRPSFAETLTGKRVVIIPDNDPVGRKHAEAIADSLYGKAASVRVLDLKVPKKGGDGSDWLDAGHTADELRDLIAKAPESEPQSSKNWQAGLIAGDRGPRACEANVAIALRSAPELAGRLRHNLLTDAAQCADLPWRRCEGWRSWTDADDGALAIWCQHRGIMVKPGAAATAAQIVATDHPYHPVRAYLDKLKWDGVPRLDAWLATYLGAENSAYHTAIGAKALIQAVARACDPGCQADHVLIVEGPQGAGKSSAVATLMPDTGWFCDEIADIGSKDSAQDLRGKWLVEISELSAMKRSEVERTKAFVSRRCDHYRPSYGRRSQDHQRQCVFIGTTNSDAYLGDESGNRRFWPTKVGRIDLAALRRDRDQLWAEAVTRYRKGERWHLAPEAEAMAAAAQAERRIIDPWEEPLLEQALLAHGLGALQSGLPALLPAFVFRHRPAP